MKAIFSLKKLAFSPQVKCAKTICELGCSVLQSVMPLLVFVKSFKNSLSVVLVAVPLPISSS